MSHLHLTSAGMALLGLGEFDPRVFGLIPMQRRQHGWIFEVTDDPTEQWRLRLVTTLLRIHVPSKTQAQVWRTVVSRWGLPDPQG